MASMVGGERFSAVRTARFLVDGSKISMEIVVRKGTSDLFNVRSFDCIESFLLFGHVFLDT